MEYDNSSSSPAKRSKAEVDSSSSESPDSRYTAFFDQIPGAKKIWGNLHGGSSGLGKDEAETVKIATELNAKNYNKLLEDYRVSMTNLSKRDEYQVSFIS